VVSKLLYASLALNPAMAQSVTNRPARPTPPHARSEYAGICHGHGIADGDVPFTGCRRKFHHRPDSPSRAGKSPPTRCRNGVNFTMSSADSKIYPGIGACDQYLWHAGSHRPRQADCDYQSSCSLHAQVGGFYVPKQYVPGTAAPFIVGADGPDKLLFTAWTI